MFDITLITMGKLKEKFYISAAEEYKKRLGGYCRFTLLELPEVRLPEDPSPAEISAGLEKEAEAILSKVPKGAWFCVFTPEGKILSSEAFADKLKEVKLSGKSSACFLIGSSFGMSPRVKEKADFKPIYEDSLSIKEKIEKIVVEAEYKFSIAEMQLSGLEV